MYLKSLVLKGFKSFADRSVMTMEPGITAIVGPNGSGKSNISDAVLWVLGERNAKNLRGQAMEDVIFAGSTARKSVGVAEVELVLDNSDGTLPVDYDEVSIGRRMFRSGESEYLINGVVSRRMDVLDILHDSGLGTGTHSIISQGSLDSILQSKPEDRRALIEEAAGVLKHKQRKAKSQKKLEHIEQHLTRVRDVVGEVERQLGPLERKAKRAMAYQELSAELADKNLQIAVDDLRVLQRAWDEIIAGERKLEEELESRRAAVSEAEKAADELQEKVRAEAADAGELARLYNQVQAAVDRFDSTALVLRERRRSALDRAAELRVSLTQDEAAHAAAIESLAAVDKQLEEVRAERSAADALVERLAKAYDEAAAKRSEVEKRAVELGRSVRDVEGRLAVARRTQAQTQEELSSNLAAAKVIDSRAADLSSQYDRAQQEAAESEAAYVKIDEERAAIAAEEQAARAAVAQFMNDRDEARVRADKAREVVVAIDAELRALREIERATAAGTGPALAWLLDSANDLSGALSPLAHALSAPAHLELLVEKLLGSDVQAQLIDSANDVRSTEGALRSRELSGSIALLLREDTSPSGRKPLARGYEGSVKGEVLVDALTYGDVDAHAVEALLGDVVVVDSLSDALAAHSQDVLGLRFVSKDGALVGPSGRVALHCAVGEDESAGVLARVRRAEKLEKELSSAQSDETAAKQSSEAAERALRDAQEASLKASQKLAEVKGRAQAALSERDRSSRLRDDLKRNLADIERQRAEAEGAVLRSQPTVESLAEEVEKLSTELEQLKINLALAQDSATPLREEVRECSDKLSAAKLSAATLAERDVYTSRVRDARASEIAQLERSASKSREILAKKQASAVRMEPLLAVFEVLSENARLRARMQNDAANAAQTMSEGLHSRVTQARAASRAARDAYDATSARLNEQRVSKSRLEIQVENAVNVIVRDCKTPLEKALELPEIENRSEVEGSVFKLRRRIANMGTINPDAAKEYEVLKKRFDYLSSQMADLDNARRSLAKIDRAIEARMKEDFIRTYEQVDKNFQEVFAVLFPGGQAHLSLVDPDNLEETGVEVSAQPRGKRITKMMLMSGGEKSLTALALLFAVYRIRTTPFYILDEVEAALDDTNLRRLVSYIESLRSTTQLIMITHQRRTMETADVLFGVSMQADGVTKVISQKLDHALKYAE